MDHDEKNKNGGEKPETPKERTVYYGVIQRHDGALSEVEAWLADNCEDEWRVFPLGDGKDSRQGHLKILFFSPSDRVRFLNGYVRTGTKGPVEDQGGPNP